MSYERKGLQLVYMYGDEVRSWAARRRYCGVVREVEARAGLGVAWLGETSSSGKDRRQQGSKGHGLDWWRIDGHGVGGK